MAESDRSLFKRLVSLVQRGPDAVNRAGGPAFQDSPRMALYRQVATSLWSGDGYYERQVEWLARFRQNVADVLAEDVRFPFALAAYARDRRDGLALRTSPVILYVEAVANVRSKGTGLARQYAPRVFQRADEPAEAIAFFRKHHQGVVPHGMLRGIADALKNFDEYQLAKYKKSGSVSMRDVLRLARPKPGAPEEQALWGRVVADALETPYTWEVELSKSPTDEEKRQKWNELIASGKLGLFALVRNIRNIVKYGADVEEALSQITRQRVVGSGILPFQWYKAYKAVATAAGPVIAEPMQQALQWSLDDLPKLPGITLVACDNSGSMSRTWRTRDMANNEIANLMGAMALYCCQEGIAGTFGNHFQIANALSQFGLLENKANIDLCGTGTGHATNAWTIFEYLIRNRIWVDRVFLFSDMQCYDSQARRASGVYSGHSLSAEFESYRQINPNVILYSVNLDSYDNTCQFEAGQPVIELAGWSENVFQFISRMEVGESILDTIAKNY
ncbi:MAG: TROVE domain-containing protein [Chloroflexota bacterium]